MVLVLTDWHVTDLLFLLEVFAADRADLISQILVSFLLAEDGELPLRKWIETLVQISILVKWLKHGICFTVFIVFFIKLCQAKYYRIISAQMRENAEEVAKTSRFHPLVKYGAGKEDIDVGEEPAQ